MKKMLLSLLTAGCLSGLVLPDQEAAACTGFYVGSDVSSDGTTLIGRTVDAAPWNGPMLVGRFGRGERTFPDGSTNAYAFVCAFKAACQQVGFYGGGAVNECGVMLSATVTGRSNDAATGADPFVPVASGGYGEPNLPDVLAGRSATAREAVELLGRLVAAHGHSGPEIYMVADSSEAWYVEVYTGHQWAAVKMPADQVAVFGNQFNIRAFDPADAENAMHSPDLVALAVAHGFAVWADESQGLIDLYKTYSPPLWDYANYRTWWGHHAWAPSTFGDDSYATATPYPLFFDPEPDLKVSLTDVFELMRTRYEGVRCPDENGDTSIRVIGTTKQQSAHVLQMRPGLPADFRCTLWECLAQAEHSTFLPVCMAVQHIPEAFSRDAAGPLAYDPARAADAFLRLDTLAELKRSVTDTYGVRQDVRPLYGAGVRAHWRAQEDRLVEEWPRMLDAWASAADPDDARASATAFVDFQQTWSLAEAKRLHDELAWFWAEFNCDLRDGGGSSDVPTRPFASSVPANAETAASWTRWHRADFHALVDELAGPAESRSTALAALAAGAEQVFDDVVDAASLADAQEDLAAIVEAICLELASPSGSRDNPWLCGDGVRVWTNGTGALIFEGDGSTGPFASAGDLPWAPALSGLSEVRVAESVSLGTNALASLPATVPVNGLLPDALFAALGGMSPAGSISGAEFDCVAIENGRAILGVAVYTNADLETSAAEWNRADIEGASAEDGSARLVVPAAVDRGFLYLRTKPAD